MSGVFGVLDGRRRTPIGQIMGQMSRALSHYEWYVVDTWSDDVGEVGLGRVGIGTFNQETQPIWNRAGNLAGWMRGELYHTDKLVQERRAPGDGAQPGSDLELVLQLYQSKGEAFIDELEGAFVLAIWDRAAGELLIANDRYGLYPLYYAHQDAKLLFAPEVKAVLCHPGLKELDMTALAEYMQFQTLLGDKTFFSGIKLLPNASLLRYHPATDRLTIRPYWSFQDLPQLPKLTLEQAAEESGRLFQAAVSTLTEGRYRLGVYLSGGLDSRLILGLIDRDRFPVTTVTYGRPNSRDMIYARRLAERAGTDHHTFPFQDGRWLLDFVDQHLELTEGFHSWIHAHGISILGQVRPLIDVNLTGLHGDPLDWDDLSLFHAQDDEAFTARLFHLMCEQTTWPSMDAGEIALLYAPELAPQMRERAFESLRTELAKEQHLAPEQRAQSFSCFHIDRRLYQYYTVFHRSHLEFRFPFYDYRYFEFTHALPPEIHMHRKLRRQVISRFVPRMASVPYDKDGLPLTGHKLAILSAKAINKGKKLLGQAFPGRVPESVTLHSDYETWLRHELYDWGQEVLLGERTLQRGLFNPRFLHSLWRRHQSGLEVHTIGKLAPIMTYEMMLRRFYDTDGVIPPSHSR